MPTSNRFNTSVQDAGYLASESTLQNVEALLAAGITATPVGTQDVDIVAQSVGNLNTNSTITDVNISAQNTPLQVATSNLLQGLKIDNPHILFRSHFESDTQPEIWDYSATTGTSITESFNSSKKAVNLTTITNTIGGFNMVSKTTWNCSGNNNLLIFTLKPVLSVATGQTQSEVLQVGFYDWTDKWGFALHIRGNDTYTFNVTANNQTLQILQSSWNVSQTIQGQRDRVMTFYFEFSDDLITLGEIFEGVKYDLHKHYVNTSIAVENFHFVELPVFIRIGTGTTFTGWTSQIYNVRLIQQYQQPYSDVPYQNNYSNFYQRTGKNTGTPVKLEAGVFGLSSTTFQQWTYGLNGGNFLDLPTTQTNFDIQISCSNNGRTTQQLTVTANQVDGTQVTSNPVTLNGQTAVNITFPNSTQIYRIASIQVTSNTMDAGGALGTGTDVDFCYISPQGQSLTNGFPDAQILGTIGLGLGISRLGYLHIPPNKSYVTLSASYTTNSVQGRVVKFAFQSKPCSADLWTTHTTAGFRNNTYFETPSGLMIDSHADGYDLRLIASQGDGTGSVDETVAIVNGIIC